MAVSIHKILFVLTFAEAFLVRSKFAHQYSVLFIFPWLGIVNLLLYIVYCADIYPRFISPLRHLPTPKDYVYPIIGHELALINKPRGQRFLHYLRTTPTTCNGLIRLHSIRFPDQLLVTSPKALAEVLVNKSYDYERGVREREVLRRVLGDGLIVVEGEAHKFQRKRLQPSFNFGHIQRLYPMIWEKAVELTELITVQSQQEPIADKKNISNGSSDDLHSSTETSTIVDIDYWAPKITLDLIGVAGLGRNLNTVRNSNDELARLYEEVTVPSPRRMASVVLNMMLPSWLLNTIPWGPVKHFDDTMSRIREICVGFLHDKRVLQGKNGFDNNDGNLSTDPSVVDILSQLVQRNEFSDDQLVDQMLTFLAAGHETTSSSFTWVLYLLSINPSIQSRLQDEIHANIPFSTFFSSPEGARDDKYKGIDSILEGLPFLNAVCNETLRLYPTVPVTSRISKAPTTILDQDVPANTRIILCPWALNRSHELWGDDAESFRPERWIDPYTGKANNSGGGRGNYANMTFLHGPRSCIGQGFAKAELRALVASFVGRFQFEMYKGSDGNNDKVEIGGMITIRPVREGGMKMRVTKIAEW